LITDAWFYTAAVPAVLIFGISKGGFGGGLGVMAVPIMALVASPLQAAAILLPILCLMDIVGAWAFRRHFLWSELRLIVPASVVGIVIGALLFEFMSASIIKLLVGLVAVLFTLHHWFQQRWGSGARAPLPHAVGALAAAASGFTSFIAHSGGPPINMYLLRRHLDRTSFVATTVYFFFAVNYIKLLPYAWLGQFNAENLRTALVLAPLAPIGVYAGIWLHRRVSDVVFFRIAYALLFLVGLKLIYDGF
jgi:uncharacterized membrane protein YfcA